MKKDLRLRVSPETIRNVIKQLKHSSRVDREEPLLSAQNVEKRLRFATKHVSLDPEYWDETKIMLYSHDGQQSVW